MSNFDFSLDAAGLDRQALLAEAAERIDRLHGHYGVSGAAQPEAEAGRKVREMINDQARLAAFPDLYRITEEDYLARNQTAPVKVSELIRQHRYYWLRIPIGLAPQAPWSFNKIEVRIEFNPDEPAAHLRPKAWQILPNRKFQKMLEAHQKLEIGLDENFEFAASSGELAGEAGKAKGKLSLGAAAKASVGGGVILGPFEYQLKRALIEHNALGMEWVFWRLDGAEFFQEDAPELIVIAQVPSETTSVKVSARLQAYRNFNLLTGDLTLVVKQLPKALREYFAGGLPLYDEQQWDLTPRL
jgi:hypothetical protein